VVILMKFLKEWNGHSPENSTYQYVDELQARVLIRGGIAEPAIEGQWPEVPRKVIENVATTSRRR
jgi:hypothetical protein